MLASDVEVRRSGKWTAARVRDDSDTHPWLLLLDGTNPSGFYPDSDVADWEVVSAPEHMRDAYLRFGNQFA